MITFWIITAGLAIIAALFVILPLLKMQQLPDLVGAGAEQRLSVYRDHSAELDEERRSGRLDADDYEKACGELEGRMLEEVAEAEAPVAAPAPRRYGAVALAIGVAVPLLALFVYLTIGNPAALRPQQADAPHGLGQQQMDAMIARLSARLEKNPQDVNGWVMLGRAQTVLGRFDAASAAYAKSVELVPNNAQLLADYADAMAMAQGERLQGEPERLIERALRVDPNNTKALALAGTVAFERKDFGLAVKHWEHLRDSIPAGSEFAKSIQGSIDEAKALAAAGAAVRQTVGVPRSAQVAGRR